MTSKEALKTLKGYLGLVDTKIIELLIPIAKDLEVLEILRNKKVDYLKLEDCIINMKLETPEYYNKGMDIVYCLTQEEYDLFMENLLCQKNQKH